MTDDLELTRRYEPMLVFSKDGDEGPKSESFFPLAAKDYVQECRLRRRKKGWEHPPSGKTLLEYLGKVLKSKKCYLAYAAGDLPEGDPGLRLLDQGFELARVGDTVMPRLLISRETADVLEESLSECGPEWRVERQPFGALLTPDMLGGGVDALASLFGLKEFRSRWEEAGWEPPDSEGIEWFDQLEDPSATAALEAILGVSSAPDVLGDGLDVLASLFDVDRTASQMEWVTLSGPTVRSDPILGKALEKYERCRDKEPVYHYHVWKDREKGWWALQYWFLYAFNDWETHGGHNNHEGDWEMVCVFLDAEKKPQWVASSVHILKPKRGKSKAKWGDLLKVEETHPVVYVGCGSHANYLERRPNEEKGPYKYWLGRTYYDYAAGNDVSIGPVESDADKHWGEPIWLDEEPWHAFEGNWGALLKSWLGLVLPGTGGPTGPVQKDKKWNHPDRWARIKCRT